MRALILSVFAFVALAGVGTALAGPPDSKNFGAHLHGAAEVPAQETTAQGQAKFKVSKSGESIGYKLIVANIEDVFAAHIHCAAAGVNGPVGVTLFAGPADGKTQGVLAQGEITAPNAGNACGWTTVEDIVDALLSGDAYVNVHTTAVPSGEIRGQVSEHGAS